MAIGTTFTGAQNQPFYTVPTTTALPGKERYPGTHGELCRPRGVYISDYIIESADYICRDSVDMQHYDDTNKISKTVNIILA